MSDDKLRSIVKDMLDKGYSREDIDYGEIIEISLNNIRDQRSNKQNNITTMREEKLSSNKVGL